ncbi:MAG: hypothetical protein RIF32_15910, partial [Leptospirales bacterium]
RVRFASHLRYIANNFTFSQTRRRGSSLTLAMRETFPFMRVIESITIKLRPDMRRHRTVCLFG